MPDFDLDLGAVEREMAEATDEDLAGRIVLGVLDGSTPDQEWIDAVLEGSVLVLAVEGNLNELAAGFARDVKDEGAQLVHFRGFLIVSPPGVAIDTDRL